MDANHSSDEDQMAPLLSPTTTDLVQSDRWNNQHSWRLEPHPFWFVFRISQRLFGDFGYNVLQVNTCGGHRFNVCTSVPLFFQHHVEVVIDDLLYIQRGMTLAPRIQVYNDIACRALSEESSRRTTIDSLRYMLNLASPSNCSSPAVQARAAQIQACEHAS